MSTRKLLLRAGVTLAAVLIPLGATAQQTAGTWVLTPYAGVYLPSNDLARLSAMAGTTSAALKIKHDNALALGGTASYWLTERVALEVGGAYAFSHAGGSFRVVDVDGNFAGSEGEKAHVLMGAAKVMFSLTPQTSDFRLRFGVGPAIINRGGTAYKADEDGKFTGLTSVGGAASLCTRLPLTNTLSLRLRAEDFMYQAGLKFRDPADPSSNFDFKRRFQNDLIFSAGLQIGFSR